MISKIKSIISICTKLLYPKQCVACEKVLLKIEKEIGICQKCAKRIRLVGLNTCMKCGSPIDNPIAEYCTNCEKTRHFFDQSKAIFRYEEPMKHSMYRFKYSNRRCYGKIYAKWAMKFYEKWIKEKEIEAIVPVPMYTPKEKCRGYNQAKIFAAELGELAEIPVVDDLILRNKETEAMKGLGKLKRKKNLLNAFTLNKNVVQFRKVLIVDDIYTTGATLDGIAKVLKDGGVARVYGLCICIAETRQ